MQRILAHLIGLIALSISLPARAQCPSNKGQVEIALSYGNKPLNNEFTTASAVPNVVTRNAGAPFATLRYFLYNRLAFGLACGTNSEKGHYADRLVPTRIMSTYTQTINFVTLEAYYVYKFRKFLEIYTSFGIGPGFTTITTTTVSTNTSPETVSVLKDTGLKLHYIPVGIRFGGRLCFFAESGIGYKGLVDGGVAFKFGQPCWWKQYK